MLENRNSGPKNNVGDDFGHNSETAKTRIVALKLSVPNSSVSSPFSFTRSLLVLDLPSAKFLNTASSISKFCLKLVSALSFKTYG